MSRFWRLASMVTVLVCIGGLGAYAEESDMSSASALSPISLRDEEFFSLDRARLDQLELAYDDRVSEGLVLLAPRVVSVAVHDELPVVVLLKRTLLRAWEHPTGSTLSLVGVDAITGWVGSARAFVDSKDDGAPTRGAVEPSPRPQGAAATATMTGATAVDARTRLGIPWVQGRIALAAIWFDRISPVVSVRLEAPPDEPPPPAQPPRPLSLPPVVPGGYTRGRASPPAPATGAAFVIDPARDGRGPILLGSVGWRVREADLVGEARSKELAKLLPAPASALAPVTLLMAAKGAGAFRQLDWTVPSLGTEAANVGTNATAYFAVDLAKAFGGPLGPGSYALYLVLLDQIVGPGLFEIR